jgi:hypothetical protein
MDVKQKIINVVTGKYGYTLKELRSKNRSAKITEARHVLIYLLRTTTKETTINIGGLLNRTHASIIHAERKIQGYVDTDNKFNAIIQDILNDIDGDATETRETQYAWLSDTIHNLGIFAVPQQITIALRDTLRSYHSNTRKIHRVNLKSYYGK